MDLPTYTSVWKIEKRLHKIYDLRLPVPIPIGQAAVFAVVTTVWVLVLHAAGVPFNHSLAWLYLLPPGMMTWLAARPLAEDKRFTELARSHVRYLLEPRAWCRMAPHTEPRTVTVTARTWRRLP